MPDSRAGCRGYCRHDEDDYADYDDCNDGEDGDLFDSGRSGGVCSRPGRRAVSFFAPCSFSCRGHGGFLSAGWAVQGVGCWEGVVGCFSPDPGETISVGSGWVRPGRVVSVKDFRR